MLTIKHICIIILSMIISSRKKYVVFCLINCLLSLIAGVTFYLLGRTTFLENYIQVKSILLILSFYLPDFLWAYALFFALSLFNNKLLSAILSFLSGFCWEILQKFSFVRGTFDFFDLFMYLTAILTAVIIINFGGTKYEKNNT